MKLAKLAPLAAVVFIAAALSGRAYAYLTASGEGVGHATVAEVDGAELGDAPIPGDALVQPLYPGGTGDLVIAVRNPNPFPVGVSTIAKIVDDTTDRSSNDGCAIELIVPPFTFAPPVRIAAGATRTITVPDGVQMPSTAPDECQGATFTLRIDVQIVTVPA